MGAATSKVDVVENGAHTVPKPALNGAKTERLHVANAAENGSREPLASEGRNVMQTSSQRA